MKIQLTGADATAGHLLVSENWYPDWHATVDGKDATVRRADHSLISVDLPAGAKEVHLWFASDAYAKGKMISIISLVAALVFIAFPLFTSRRRTAPA
jgi:uncharacterized membrane protein YfhO